MPEPQPSPEGPSQVQPSAEDPPSSISHSSAEDPSSQSQSSSENPSQPRRPKTPTHPRRSRSYQQYQRRLQRDAQCRNVNGARRQNTRHAPNHDSHPNDVVQSNNAGHSNNTCHSIVSNFSNPVIHNANHFHNGPPPYPPMAGLYGFDGQTVRLFQPGLGVPTQTFNFPTAGYYQEPAYSFQAPPYEGVPHQDHLPQQGHGPYQGYGPAVPSWFRPEQSWPGSYLPVGNLMAPMMDYQMTPMYPMASFQEYHGSGLDMNPVDGQWGYPAAHPETSPVADLYAYPEAAGPIDAANSAPISRGDHEVDTRAGCPPPITYGNNSQIANAGPSTSQCEFDREVAWNSTVADNGMDSGSGEPTIPEDEAATYPRSLHDDAVASAQHPLNPNRPHEEEENRRPTQTAWHKERTQSLGQHSSSVYMNNENDTQRRLMSRRARGFSWPGEEEDRIRI